MAIGYWLLENEAPILKPLEQATDGVLLRIRVQPRASRTEVVGLHGDRVRIRLSSPPIDGRANEELICFLAERLDVPRSTVRLVSGQSSRSKIVVINGGVLQEVAARLGL